MYTKMNTLPYAGITQIKFKGQRLTDLYLSRPNPGTPSVK